MSIENYRNFLVGCFIAELAVCISGATLEDGLGALVFVLGTTAVATTAIVGTVHG